jgi:hypothetical protein
MNVECALILIDALERELLHKVHQFLSDSFKEMFFEVCGLFSFFINIIVLGVHYDTYQSFYNHCIFKLTPCIILLCLPSPIPG